MKSSYYSRSPGQRITTTVALPLAVQFALCSACSKQPDSPVATAATSGEETPAPAARAAPPPLPQPYEGTLTQPIHVPMGLVAASVNAQLPDHETHPRTLLTRPNASPAIEASYEIWRDPVSLRFDGSDLHVEVPLRYAAKFSARLKNPFGGKWLKVAEDADWGTADAPQRVTLRVHTHVEITPNWELHLHTEVEPPDHGAPPEGNLCTGGAFRLCISADTLAPEVRRRIDAEIVPRIKAELETLDRRIEGTVNLRVRAEQVWQQLTQPRALGEHDRFSVIEPRQAALELRAENDEIVLEPAIDGRVTFHQGRPPAAVAPPLPDRVALDALPGERTQDTRVFAIDPVF